MRWVIAAAVPIAVLAWITGHAGIEPSRQPEPVMDLLKQQNATVVEASRGLDIEWPINARWCNESGCPLVGTKHPLGSSPVYSSDGHEYWVGLDSSGAFNWCDAAECPAQWGGTRK